MGPGIVLLLLVLLIVYLASRGGHTDKFNPSCRGGRGPYGIQLYDSPHYYPYYEPRDHSNTRCAVYCSVSEDGGCAVSCR